MKFMDKIPKIKNYKDKENFDQGKRFRYEVYKHKSKCTGIFRRKCFSLRTKMITKRVIAYRRTQIAINTIKHGQDLSEEQRLYKDYNGQKNGETATTKAINFFIAVVAAGAKIQASQTLDIAFNL